MTTMFRMLALLACTACTVGTNVESFAPATHPRGILVSVQTRVESFDAELLAVSDSGLLLLRPPALVFARYTAIRLATFRQSPEVVERAAPDSATRDRLRLLSRFPQGVTAAGLQALLAGYHQDSVLVLQP
jgi:hypothetical protein